MCAILESLHPSSSPCHPHSVPAHLAVCAFAGFNCMLGPLDAQPKERKVAVRQKRGPLGELTRPDELDGIVEKEKQETDRNMEIMWDIIRRDPTQVGGAHHTRVVVGFGDMLSGACAEV